MIIIVEGIDRCGKTTLIDRLCKFDNSIIRFKDYNVCSKTYNDEGFKDFSLGKLDTTVAMLKQLSEQGFDVIVDRLHLTELVYGSVERNQTSHMEIGELDNRLAEMKSLLVLVEPTDLAWSNEQAEKDQTEHYHAFKSAYINSAIEKYHTDFNHLGETIEYIFRRREETNSIMANGMILFVKSEGRKINNTKEIINDVTEFEDITTAEILNTFNLDKTFTMNFEYDVKNKTEGKYGPYDMKYYHDIFDKLESAIDLLVTDNINTRRCIIQFDKDHCFQYIQFLIRDNKLTVICNMRSCNVEDNYKSDIFICSILADKLKEIYANKFRTTLHQTHDIIMNVGSLHAFIKEENKNASEQRN